MALSVDQADGSSTFIHVPNELKLMFAEELGIHDVNALARTSREMKMLLTRFMYRRAKDSSTKKGRPHFLQAVDDGNLAAVERFIEVGAMVNMTDTVTDLPETAIHSCAYFGHVEIAKFLIDKGINVSAVDRRGSRALLTVVMGMHPKKEMATILVEAGADIEATWNSGTALHDAAAIGDVRTVQWLLDLGANPNPPDGDGSRPVHMAAAGSHGAALRSLLEAGQNVEIADNQGRTPLHDAAAFGRIETVNVLLEMGADASSIDRRGWTPLHYAVYFYGNEASVHRILHLGASMADQVRGIQMYAAETDMPDCVPSCQLEEHNHTVIEMLLGAGADIAKLDHDNGSPLRWAAMRATLHSLGPRGPDYLIRDGCLINQEGVGGNP